MLRQSFAVLLRRDLPEFLEAEAEFLRLAFARKIETRNELLA